MFRLPNYTNKDLLILVGSMIPLAILINICLFGNRYFSEWPVFLYSSIISFLVLVVNFNFYGHIALAFRERFPADSQFILRAGILALIFVTLSGLILFVLFMGYELIGFYGYTFNEKGFTTAYIGTAIMNIFLIIFHEGINRFERLKQAIIETEQLKKEYTRSQLLSLKSQVSPHFLFNTLNSLSCLIHEDPEKAEFFLDEMSKVYRYLLRTHEEPFVELHTELQFIQSYYSLLTERYGEALILETDVEEETCCRLIAPLTLQILFEHAINNNIATKETPLRFSIRSSSSGWLEITYNLQRRLGADTLVTAGLENIREKYRLLYHEPVRVYSRTGMQVVALPLLDKKKEEAV